MLGRQYQPVESIANRRYVATLALQYQNKPVLKSSGLQALAILVKNADNEILPTSQSVACGGSHTKNAEN